MYRATRIATIQLSSYDKMLSDMPAPRPTPPCPHRLNSGSGWHTAPLCRARVTSQMDLLGDLLGTERSQGQIGLSCRVSVTLFGHSGVHGLTLSGKCWGPWAAIISLNGGNRHWERKMFRQTPLHRCGLERAKYLVYI